MSNTRLIPVPDWNKYHAWPPKGGLRHLIFNADTNGFKTAFKRVGRRVLERFRLWCSGITAMAEVLAAFGR
jgi:hypothetical protein